MIIVGHFRRCFFEKNPRSVDFVFPNSLFITETVYGIITVQSKYGGVNMSIGENIKKYIIDADSKIFNGSKITIN